MGILCRDYSYLYDRLQIVSEFPLPDGAIPDSITVLPRRHSAAAASDSFGRAADSMKSEMRGTISDLNREPLKTP
jgi:hypothetical protein